MRKYLEIGGYIAGVVLVLFGAVALYMGIDGRSTVSSTLKQEQIVGSPDMTPAGIAAEAKAAHIPSSVSLPTCNVAGKTITDGTSARCFAGYMRIHALEATGGLTYAQMPRFATADGKGTNVATAALKRPTGQPLDNPARTVWINETALATALNVSYMASQLALFGIVVGIALLLSGLGFIILAAGGTLRRPAPVAATDVKPAATRPVLA
jgi:putative Mn2+ efflux pump MntP